MRAEMASVFLVGFLASVGLAALPSAAAEEEPAAASPLTVTYYYLPG